MRIKRLPIIRHVRYFWHAWHLRRWVELWERHGYFTNERDLKYLDRIWRGEV